MNSSGIGSGPWTRGKKRIADEGETREEEKKQIKKRQKKAFGPRLIPSASGSSDSSSSRSILIGPNDIVVNPSIPKIQIPQNLEVKPKIKEEEMELECSTNAGFQTPTPPVQNEIHSKDEVDSTGQGAAGVEETEEIANQLDSGQVREENPLRILDLEKKLKEKDLRIRELELKLEKQSNQQLSRELANAKGASTSNEDGVMNSAKEDSLNTMVRAITSGKSKQQFQSMFDNVEVKNNEGDTILHAAGRAGNLEFVKYLISNGHGVNVRNVYGSTPLMETARAKENFLEIADLLIRSGADLKATNKIGESALFIAVEEGKTVEEIRKLCFENCLKVIRSPDGNTVLHRAAMSGNLEALEHFMSLEPDVDVKNYEGCTPLISAASFAEKNFSPIVDLLLKNGADATSIDHMGLGVVNYAIHSRKYQRPMSDLKKLIDAGADWDKDSILHLCITKGHTEALKYFAANGANLDDDRDRPTGVMLPIEFTPLTRAARFGNIEAMVSLLENGATNFRGYMDLGELFFSKATTEVLDKLFKVRDIWDGSIFHGFARNGNLEGVRWCLFKKRADANAKDINGETALFVAATAEEPNWELLDFLIELGAKINEVNGQGFHALHVATERGRSLEVLETLIKKYGASWSKGVVEIWQDESILHAAIRGGHPEVVEYFVTRGADVNCTDYDDEVETPLILAVKLAERNLPEILQALVKNGADPNAKDYNGNSALLLGVHKGKQRGETTLSLDLLKVLVAFGCDWRVPNMRGETVISLLEDHGNVEVLKYFKSIEYGLNDMLP